MPEPHAERAVALVSIIAPIVEGQLRTFGLAHPSVVEAVNWRYSQPTKLDAFVASAAKRVSRALLCPETVARLRSALDRAGDTEAGKLLPGCCGIVTAIGSAAGEVITPAAVAAPPIEGEGDG